MTIESVLVAKDLSRDYQQGNLNLSVLKAVNLDIKRGEKLAIVGVSGSGKTTLLNLLGGLDDPSSDSMVITQSLRWQYLSCTPSRVKRS